MRARKKFIENAAIVHDPQCCDLSYTMVEGLGYFHTAHAALRISDIEI